MKVPTSLPFPWAPAAAVVGCCLWFGQPAASAEDDADAEPAEDIVSLDPLLGDAAWGMGPEEVEALFEDTGFAWLSETARKNAILRSSWGWDEIEEESEDGDTSVSIRSVKRSPQLFDGSLGVEEINFHFGDESLDRLSISIWNKGDSREILEEQFERLLATVSAELDRRMGVPGKELGRDSRSASRAYRTRWEGEGTIAQLEHSFTKSRDTGFQSEFIRLRLVPKTRLPLGSSARANVAKVSRSSLVENVARSEGGDVWVEGIPMVDQGDKGYCAVASAERVMRYYGIRCDQHDLAQAAGTSFLGTDPDLLQEALHRLQTRFKIRVRDIIHWDLDDYAKFTGYYNREAKKLGVRQCPEGHQWISFSGLDERALRLARCRNGAYEKFRESVVSYTSKGVPMLWALELGIFPENGEPNPQSGGGHMRVILGFNEKTDEVIFSDSWGAGHEHKRMAGMDAYTTTKGLYIIEPQAR